VNSHLEIAVTDTGAGIAPDQIPYLFQRFWQADGSASRRYGGLGLGLAIARHLAELHGGTVVAESAGEGQGSTFTLKLPVLALARLAGEDVRRQSTVRETAPRTRLTRLDGLSVLLVDDDAAAGEAAGALLERCGASVRVADSAAQALEALDDWTPDVLVSDIGMPGENGYALLARVRARPGRSARVPAIALTAFASVDDRVRLLSAGFQLHLAKPADPSELTAGIAALAAGRLSAAPETT
jgi:CheY-like chemotaxis protein